MKKLDPGRMKPKRLFEMVKRFSGLGMTSDGHGHS